MFEYESRQTLIFIGSKRSNSFRENYIFHYNVGYSNFKSDLIQFPEIESESRNYFWKKIITRVISDMNDFWTRKEKNWK